MDIFYKYTIIYAFDCYAID